MRQFILPSIYWLVAFFLTLPIRRRAKYQRMMLVSEKGNDARDNGYHFFLYVKQNHPEIDAYYIISDDSPDRARLAAYESHLVRYLSFRHCMMFWKAHYLVGTHLRAGHTPLPFALVKYLNRYLHIYRGKKVANIKHGITKNYIGRMVYENTHYDLMVCGAAPEEAYMRDALHYPPTVARYTGFCRFDKLLDFKVKRQILVMPTWRKYLNSGNLKGSKYYRSFEELLCSKRLEEVLERYDIDLVFYPHHRLQPYVEEFKRNGMTKRIIIADLAHYDVQQLLKESALMVTDYSSVLFDFIYMRKPVVFYQFDREEYWGKHMARGYVDEDAFGPVKNDVDSLIDEMEKYLSSGMRLETQYLAEVERFFPMHDAQNCERVYEALMQC